MFIKYLLVLVLIIKTSIVYCQEETGDYDENNNSVSLKTGYGAIRIKDRVISTFAYSGNSVPVQIDYYHTGSKIRFNTTYTLNASGTIEAVTPTLDGFSYKGDYGTSIENTIGTLDHKTIESKFYVFEMELLFKLAQLTNKLTMFSGVSYNNIRMDKKYLMLEYTNNSNSKYSSLSFISSLEYQIAKRHKITYSAWLPLITKTKRTLILQYGTQYQEDIIKWTAIPAFLSLNNKITYNLRLHKNWSLEAQYRFTYYQYKLPRRDQGVLQFFTLGGNFHF